MAPVLEHETEIDSRQETGQRTRVLIAAAVAALLGSSFAIREIGPAEPSRGKPPNRRPAPLTGHARLLAAKASGLALRRPARRKEMRLRITLEDTSYDVAVEMLAETEAAWEQDLALAAVPESVLQPPHRANNRPEDKICRSPIAGMVVAIQAAPHQRVRQGDPLVVIEAMKMQNTIAAPLAGVVEQVLVKPGDPVKPGQVLCTIL
jgi:biotin carboxyl carrier protein